MLASSVSRGLCIAVAMLGVVGAGGCSSNSPGSAAGSAESSIPNSGHDTPQTTPVVEDTITPQDEVDGVVSKQRQPNVSTIDAGNSAPDISDSVHTANGVRSADESTTIPITLGRTWKEIDDPSADGWSTETFHERAKKQLDKLGQLLIHPNKIATSTLTELVSPDFACDWLVPDTLRSIFSDQSIKVERAQIAGTKSGQPRDETKYSVAMHHGSDGLANALRHAGASWAQAQGTRFQFKVVRVVPAKDFVLTRQHLSVSGQTETGVIEQHAVWHIHWTEGSDGSPPKLRWIGVDDFEQARSRIALTAFQSTQVSAPAATTNQNLQTQKGLDIHSVSPSETSGSASPDRFEPRYNATLFSDCTESILGQNDCYRDELLRGQGHWLSRLAYRDVQNIIATPGTAVGDVNGDGLDDLYFCQGPGLPNRLFLQSPDGTVREMSQQWGVNWLEDSRGALIVDLDNDGDQDLVVGIVGNLVIAANERNQEFRVRAVLPTSESVISLCANDYDRNGRLDVYVCAWGPDQHLTETEVGLTSADHQLVFHDANNGPPNTLYRNDTTDADHWQFVDVTAEVGLDVNNRRWSLAAAWEDFDNDGDDDLYVSNDSGWNNLYRSQLKQGKRTFVDVAPSASAKDSAFGMSITWGDYDRDGHMDAYVSNMFSAAGNRVMHQPQFKSEAAAETRQQFARLARGNTLLRNLGDGRFVDTSDTANVTLGRWGWSSNFVDINNDGWDDLVVANGFISTDDTGDL